MRYVRAARIRYKQTLFYSHMLASSGRKQLNTNARKHATGVRLHQRNVETAFQWCKWPQTCEVMFRSDAWLAIRPALGMTHWKAKSTLWWVSRLEVLTTRLHKSCWIHWADIASTCNPKTPWPQPIYAKHDKNKKYGRRKKVGTAMLTANNTRT